MISSAASICLNVDVGVPLAGRGLGARPSQAVAGAIEANVILLPGNPVSIALVAIDTLFCSDALHIAVLSELKAVHGIDLADLVLVASHTHNAPSLDPSKPGLGLVDEVFFAAAVQSIASAIAKAVRCQTATPVYLESSTDSCTANVVRRRRTVRVSPRPPFVEISMQMLPNRRVETPHDLRLIVARDQIGKPAWVMWQWACHATAFPDSLTISADFPGIVRAHIRKIFEDAALPVVYLPGFAGDVRADIGKQDIMLRKRVMTPFARPFPDATRENFDSLCTTLCATIDRALSSLTSIPSFVGDVSSARTMISFDELMKTPRTGEIALMRIDAAPLHFLFMGAETCSPYAALLAPYFPKDALLCGYAGEVPLYLPVDAQIAEGGYEVDGFRHSFDLPGRYFPAIQAKVCAAVASLQTTKN